MSSSEINTDTIPTPELPMPERPTYTNESILFNPEDLPVVSAEARAAFGRIYNVYCQQGFAAADLVREEELSKLNLDPSVHYAVVNWLSQDGGEQRVEVIYTGADDPGTVMLPERGLSDIIQDDGIEFIEYSAAEEGESVDELASLKAEIGKLSTEIRATLGGVKQVLGEAEATVREMGRRPVNLGSVRQQLVEARRQIDVVKNRLNEAVIRTANEEALNAPLTAAAQQAGQSGQTSEGVTRDIETVMNSGGPEYYEAQRRALQGFAALNGQITALEQALSPFQQK